MTTKLAQDIKIPDTLQHWTSPLKSKQALQASALVGRRVFVNSDVLQLAGEGVAQAAIELTQNASQCTVHIFAPTKERVATLTFDALKKGLFEFEWDGLSQSEQRLPAGAYHLEVQAICNDQTIVLKTMTAANVDSVSLGQNGEGLRLHIAGRGSVSLQEVRFK